MGFNFDSYSLTEAHKDYKQTPEFLFGIGNTEDTEKYTYSKALDYAKVLGLSFQHEMQTGVTFGFLTDKALEGIGSVFGEDRMIQPEEAKEKWDLEIDTPRSETYLDNRVRINEMNEVFETRLNSLMEHSGSRTTAQIVGLVGASILDPASLALTVTTGFGVVSMLSKFPKAMQVLNSGNLLSRYAKRVGTIGVVDAGVDISIEQARTQSQYGRDLTPLEVAMTAILSGAVSGALSAGIVKYRPKYREVSTDEFRDIVDSADRQLKVIDNDLIVPEKIVIDTDTGEVIPWTSINSSEADSPIQLLMDNLMEQGMRDAGYLDFLRTIDIDKLRRVDNPMQEFEKLVKSFQSEQLTPTKLRVEPFKEVDIDVNKIDIDEEILNEPMSFGEVPHTNRSGGCFWVALECITGKDKNIGYEEYSRQLHLRKQRTKLKWFYSDIDYVIKDINELKAEINVIDKRLKSEKNKLARNKLNRTRKQAEIRVRDRERRLEEVTKEKDKIESQIGRFVEGKLKGRLASGTLTKDIPELIMPFGLTVDNSKLVKLNKKVLNRKDLHRLMREYGTGIIGLRNHSFAFKDGVYYDASDVVSSKNHFLVDEVIVFKGR